MKNNITISIPVFSLQNLKDVARSLDYGISLYRGIIVIWDEDHDPRVFTLIDEYFQIGTKKPFAINEHEANVSILWKEESDASNGMVDYDVEDDNWVATDYYKDGDFVRFVEDPQL